MHPGNLIIIGILSMILLAWIYWPRKGLLAMIRRAARNSLKVQLEDALKFLFDCEYRKVPSGLHSIAGNLNISSSKTAEILDHLQQMDLIISKGDHFELTDAGRSYALRIIRVHRIWEKYLADETSINETEWHRVADQKEHEITAESADKVASQIGNPVFDPHGDPIPTSEGEMPQYKGKSLATLKEGDIGRILHIEDEPASIYEQLTALGIYPGMQIYVLDVSAGRISFAAEGQEQVLTPLFASAITVELVPDIKPIVQKHELLSSLQPGEKAEVIGISPHCRGQQRRRLLDLGIVPGTVVSSVIQSPSGDPTGYSIMGAVIGIRKSQADLIYITRKEETA